MRTRNRRTAKTRRSARGGRIAFDPAVMGGQACIRGTRIPVATIIRCVASRMTNREILDAYPDINQSDIAAALDYAARLTEDREILVSRGGI